MSSDTQEVVVARLRPHARAMFLPSLGLIAIVAATAYFAGSFDSAMTNVLVIGAAVMLSLFVWLVPFLAWLGRNYTITTRRVILRSGFFVRVRQELLHSRGYDITVRKSALQSMFGSGDVVINTELDRPVLLRDVPDANLVQEALHDLIERSVASGSWPRVDDGGDRDETGFFGGR